jgi:hypothetical protein
MHSNDIIEPQDKTEILLDSEPHYVFDVEIDSPDIDSHRKMVRVFSELKNSVRARSVFNEIFDLSELEADIPEFAEEDCRITFFIMDNKDQDLALFSKLFANISNYDGMDFTVSIIDYDLEKPLAKCRQFQGGKETKHLTVTSSQLIESGLMEPSTLCSNLFTHSDEVQRYFGLK